MQKELITIIQSIIHGKKAEIDDRKRIDAVCSLINTFDVTNDNQVMFSFNDEMMVEGKEHDDNYSIKIRDKKNFENYYTTINHAIDGFEQNESGCKFYGDDFLSMLSVLRKTIMEYDQIPNLDHEEKVSLIQSDSKRINKFTVNYDEKIRTAQERLEEESNSKLFENESASLEDLMGMFDEQK